MNKNIVLICALLFSSFFAQSQNAESFARRANSKLEIGDYNGALTDFSSAIRLQPEYEVLYKAYFGRGYCYFQLGDYKKAKKDFDRSIKEYANDAEVFFWRAYTKYKLRYSAASEIADYNRAITLKPEYAEAYFNRGQARIKNKQERAGCNDLRKAYELGYEEALIHIKIHCGEP
ncbi:MAG: tetratricopeptide repeat protein [Bacteroidota bacterium]